MDGLISFFADNVCLLFLANGLAFFTLGLAIALETRRARVLPMSRNLWLLSGYGFCASLGNLLQMYLISQQQAPTLASSASAQDILKLLLFVLAAVLLLQFSVRILASHSSRLRWVKVGYWVVAAVFAGVFVIVLGRAAASDGDWIASVEVWARYLLYFPALAMAALAFLLQRRGWSGMGMHEIDRDCLGAASMFGLKMIVSGLAAVPILGLSGPTMSTWVLGLQSARTVSTVAIAYFVVRMLRASEVQRQRELDQANAARFAAQGDALRAQQEACDELNAWNASMADMVHSISLAISQPRTLEETMRAVLQETIKLSELQAGAVFLLDRREAQLNLVALEGLPEWMADYLTKVKVGDGLTGWVAETGELMIVEDVANDQRPLVPRFAEFVTFVVGIPLQAGGQILGVMNLYSQEHHELTRQQVALLTATGHQLGVAINAARLSQRIRYLATTEERSRLAREIHDNLAQLLGYLNLKASSAMQYLADGRTEQAHDTLLEVKRIAQNAYGDARETIFSLRAPTLDHGFLPALQAYLDEYSTYYGVHAELRIDDPSVVRFSPDLGIQISCIIQEALTNVRRHADASRVRLQFEAHEATVQISIEDNGRGFDPKQLAEDRGLRFGVSIMRERAESVGGSLEMDSWPGEGTRLVVCIPRSSEG